MNQTISQFDLIFISDAGTPFVIHTKDVNGDHQPDTIELLDEAFQPVPLLLRDEGTTLAIMPDAPALNSGCTCTLLNMQSIKNSLKAPDANMASLATVHQALKSGGTVTVTHASGKTERLAGSTRK